MKRFIYADNAATTKLDTDAYEAMKPFLLYEYGNVSQEYSFARRPRQALSQARSVIAECINAHPDEIYFTSGGTESNNWAIKGIAFADNGNHGVIASAIEHHSVLYACEAIKKHGHAVTILPVTAEGLVTVKSLEKAMSEDTRLVSVMSANNEIGTIQPIRELCEIAHRKNALFHTDAVSVTGHIPVDVRASGVDMLSASAHKFNGPKGVGFLYIKKGTPVAPLFNGGAHESGLRAGTENIAAIVGMSVALKKSCDAVSRNECHLKRLEEILIGNISGAGLDFIRNGSQRHIPGHISLSFRNADGEVLLHRLDLMGIAVSTGAACDNGSENISHVLHATGCDENYAKGTLRISFGHENTVEDAEIISEKLISILR